MWPCWALAGQCGVPAPLESNSMKESWEQKPAKCGFRKELERTWNVVTGDCIFYKPLKEFCTGVLKNGIIAGKVVKPKKFFLFCVKWSQRRCVWACRCVVFGKTRKTYLLENTIQGAVSFRVETHGGGALVPSGRSQPWMGGSSSWWLLLPQWN